MSPTKTLTTGLLIAGLSVGTYAALGRQPPAPAEAPPSSTPAEMPPGHPDPVGADVDVESISGKVLEIVQVPSYTYLRLDRGEEDELWVAVPKSSVAKGETVRLARAERMENFVSKQLERTFSVIYFGTLATGPLDAPLSNPHTSEPGQRSGRAAAADLVKLVPSVPAGGDNGHTISEIYDQASKLAGQKIRVRGTVVQVTMNVMGTNFIHLRDGSGNEEDRTHDLVLKVAENPPAVGKQALFEGTLQTEVDLGAGYTYRALVSDARITEDE